MNDLINLVINNFSKWFVMLTTSITLIFTIRTFYMNKISEQPRIKIIFESIDPSKARTKYNLIVKNDSDKPIYNFQIINSKELNDMAKYKEIGFINNTIPIFESGQIFKSHFADFKQLDQRGFEKIQIHLQYTLKKKGKIIKEKYEYNINSYLKFLSIVIDD